MVLSILTSSGVSADHTNFDSGDSLSSQYQNRSGAEIYQTVGHAAYDEPVSATQLFIKQASFESAKIKFKHICMDYSADDKLADNEYTRIDFDIRANWGNNYDNRVKSQNSYAETDVRLNGTEISDLSCGESGNAQSVGDDRSLDRPSTGDYFLKNSGGCNERDIGGVVYCLINIEVELDVSQIEGPQDVDNQFSILVEGVPPADYYIQMSNDVGISHRPRSQNSDYWSHYEILSVPCSPSGKVQTQTYTVKIIDPDVGSSSSQIQPEPMQWKLYVTNKADAGNSNPGDNSWTSSTDSGGDITGSGTETVSINIDTDKVYAFVVSNIYYNNSLKLNFFKGIGDGVLADFSAPSYVNSCADIADPEGIMVAGCSLSGSFFVTDLHDARRRFGSTDIGIDYVIRNLTTMTNIDASGTSVSPSGNTNQDNDNFSFNLGYPDIFKSHEAVMNLELWVMKYEASGSAVNAVALVMVATANLTPWDVASDGYDPNDNVPPESPDCVGTDSPPNPCDEIPQPEHCIIQPCQTYTRASKGTSLAGRDHSLYLRFDHVQDASRMYQFDYSVRGPGVNTGVIRETPEVQGFTIFDITNYNPPSPDKHLYEWEVKWEYNVPEEQRREADWIDWRDEHIDWGPEHQQWHDVDHPAWVIDYADWLSEKPKAIDYPSHDHTCNCTDTTTTNPDGSTSTSTSCDTCAYSHHAAALQDWREDKPKEPKEPEEPSPPPASPYLDTPDNPVGDRSGQVYNSSYHRASYTGPILGLFGDSFPYYEVGPLIEVHCSSEQLVITPPLCHSVKGHRAPVGQSIPLTSALYSNPNRPHEAGEMYADAVTFIIPRDHHHAPTNGRGPPGSMTANSNTIFQAVPLNLNLPGDYQANWSLEWSIRWGDALGTWPQAIDYVGNQPTVYCNSGSPVIQIVAQPPTCKVIDWHWEVEPSGTLLSDSLIRIEVELTNPNRVPIAVNAASYTITDIGSGNASNLSSPPGPSAPVHDPIYSTTTYPSAPKPQYIPANGGTVTLISQNHPYHEPGQYNYNWSGLDVFLGIERWNTSGGPDNHPSAYSEPIGPCREILRLAYLPYIKVYEGDVAVGGRFGTGSSIDACNSGNSIIGTKGDSVAEGRTYGFSKHTGTSSIGASVEYALRAFSSVYGYYSASQRTAGGTPSPHTGLTLANTPSNPGTPHGGDYGHGATNSFANRRCIANYWAVITNNQQTDTIVRGSLDGGSLDLADTNLVPENSRVYHDGDLNITASSPLEINSAIYVKGDIFINSDIVNNHVKAWQQDRRKVGSLYLIAKGNVYISRDVGQVDAIIIAIPPGNNPADKGIVYTCSGGGTSTTTHLGATNHHRLCSKQLTVNGAVIARSIVLGRTHGSRNLGSAFEHPDGSPDASNVAEIFYFSPEYYVSLPIASSAESQIDRDKYYRSDSIISLPPLF